MRTIEITNTPAQYKRKIPFLALLLILRNRTMILVWTVVAVFTIYMGTGPLLGRVLETFGLLVMGLVLAYPFLYSRVAKQLAADPALLGPYHVSIEPEGLRWVTKRSNHLQPWKSLSGPWLIARHLILLQPTCAHSIPLRAFTDAEELAEWRKELRRHIQEAQ